MQHKVITIRPLCLLIRLAPVAVIIAVHCCKGSWPTKQECFNRALRHGFSIKNFSGKWYCLWTHIFVHFTDEHLLSNVLSLSYALLEFSHGGTLQALEEKSLSASLRSAVGSLAIMLLAGPIGGIGGQMLYNKLRVDRPVGKAIKFVKKNIRLPLDFRESHPASAGSPLGSVLETLGTGYETLARLISISMGHIWRFLEDCSFGSASRIQKIVNRSTVICGSSAAVCGIAGFNAVFFRNPVGMICLVFPDIVLQIQNLFSYMCASRSQKLVNVWKGVMARQTVGHAGHLGGFAVGAAIGWVLSHILKPDSCVHGEKDRPQTNSN